MDASTYGRLVERGGYATGGIVLGFDGSADGASSMVAYDPGSGRTFAWDFEQAREAGRAELRRWREFYEVGADLRGTGPSDTATLRGHIERARSESPDEALNGFDGWPAAVASWERNASEAGNPPLGVTYGLDGPSALARLLAGPMVAKTIRTS